MNETAPSHDPPRDPAKARLYLQRMMLTVAGLVVLGFLLVAGLLLTFQHQLIYFPSDYPSDYQSWHPIMAEEITTETSQGRQVSFYYSPKSENPRRLWVMFHGNASLALHWQYMIEQIDAPDCGFLMVEYPGYGFSEGSPTPARIQEAADAALTAVLQRWPESARSPELCTLGFSLGAGAAFQFASRHPIRQVIALAPFTSMRDMAAMTVGRPLHLLAIHRFDNRSRLAELAKRDDPPQVHIHHGTDDRVIPHRMGEELARTQPSITEFHSYQGIGHNSLPDTVWQQLPFSPSALETNP